MLVMCTGEFRNIIGQAWLADDSLHLVMAGDQWLSPVARCKDSFDEGDTALGQPSHRWTS